MEYRCEWINLVLSSQMVSPFQEAKYCQQWRNGRPTHRNPRRSALLTRLIHSFNRSVKCTSGHFWWEYDEWRSRTEHNLFNYNPIRFWASLGGWHVPSWWKRLHEPFSWRPDLEVSRRSTKWPWHHNRRSTLLQHSDSTIELGDESDKVEDGARLLYAKERNSQLP